MSSGSTVDFSELGETAGAGGADRVLLRRSGSQETRTSAAISSSVYRSGVQKSLRKPLRDAQLRDLHRDESLLEGKSQVPPPPSTRTQGTPPLGRKGSVAGPAHRRTRADCLPD